VARTKRDRSVVFRVSEQEYNCLKSACEAAGGHTLSEYTRSELLSGMHAAFGESLLAQRFFEIDRKLAELYRLTNQMLKYVIAGENKGNSRSTD
jgi:hypothetical protein